MSCFRSDRGARRVAAAAALLLLTGLTTPLRAQDAPAEPVAPAVPAATVVSSEYTISGNEAMLRLELAGGRTVELATRDGGAYVNGSRIGDAARGGELDRSWRELLTRAMDTDAAALPDLLRDWSAPGAAGAQMKGAVTEALAHATTAGSAPMTSPIPDSVSRLVQRIGELERTVDRLEDRRYYEPRRSGSGPWHNISEGFAGLFATLITWFVLFGIGFGIVFFGGRKYLAGVSDTARHATGRSFLVGLAGSFLLLPVYILGTLLLAISIVGIPGLLVWVPGLPVAAGLALIFGYIAIAHAAGESFAERRFYVADWLKRGNSYYYLLIGIGLLLSMFLAAPIVHMGGNWLEPLFAVLMVFGVVITVLAFCVGFGAVLLSRAGTRPVRGAAEPEPDLFETTEEASV